MTADAVLVLAADNHVGALEALTRPLARRLAAAGWSRRSASPFLWIYAPRTSRVAITPAFDGHGAIIGDLFDHAGAPLADTARRAVANHALTAGAAARFVETHWGRYLLIRRSTAGTSVLRDPSGALDCVVWRQPGLTVIASSAAAALDPFLPDDIGLDWAEVGHLARRPGEFRHPLALRGLYPVAAGALATVSEAGATARQIWTPADVYRRKRRPIAPDDLRDGVRTAVQALAGDRTWVAELSGGLDSAVVGMALSDDQRARVTAWVNHYVADPEGDERTWARAVLEPHRLSLTEVLREGLALDEGRLSRAAESFRPAINDLDPDYNDDIAARIKATGAWGSLTGQGGDAVFFQMATPLILADEIVERGLRARPAVAHRLARWTRRSLWPQTLWRAWRTQRRTERDPHPWLDDLKRVPPAKAQQIEVMTYCQTFQAPAFRSRLGPCVHPLLSQPVMELGLAMSTVDLTWGGRDRAALRAAFSADLPERLIRRRSKGELGAYYGRAVAAHLPFLRDYLLGGALAQNGVLDPALEDRLSYEHLLWRGGHGEILSLALTEAWTRRWLERLGRRRPV